ncbi:MAG: CHASE2 domain-containing protein [Scytonematopsis contorta HA4267-MV1]|jgi:CHASE2 domain-containing sensor protein|nr:CHASE2 domain-containing protein [Scytonematopsis contorta HA4267-MV1]
MLPHNPKAKFRPVALLISIAATFLVSGIRNQGMLQHGELQIYDQMIRLRNDENIDSRLLIIEVTEEDLQYQNQLGFVRQGSLSDEALAQIVARIEPLKPSVIGLDIYRDFPTKKLKTNLADILSTNDNFFAICKHNDPLVKHPGTAPPNEVPNERLGFSDVIADGDGVLRRYVFQMTANINSPCPTETSFSFQLALHYLHKKGLKVIPEITKDGNVQIDKVTIPIITSDWGGYQNLEDKGYQMMLNYRSRNIAEKVTLSEVLQGKLKSDSVKNKIVLIGTTAPTYKDELYTPYSLNRQPDQAMHGVVVQAQMVSQITSAVLDKQPLIRVWSNWLGTIWIAGWSFIAGGIALYCRKPVVLVLLTVLTILISSVSSFCFFVIQSTWIPIIPVGLVIVIVVVAVATSKNFQLKSFWARL